MLQEEKNEERDYDENIESTLRFCRQADSELREIEDRIIHQDRELIFKYWDLK